MLDLHICLSASVNVRYVLHTQPIGLYNKVLVWVSPYSFPSLSILVGLSFSPRHLLATAACYPFTSLILSFISHQPYSSDGERRNLQHQ
jgi:hypothetical protein